MPVERRGQAIVFEIGSTGDGRNPIINGRRQPSRGGTSRMNREVQVRICERLGVKFPGPTRPSPELDLSGIGSTGIIPHYVADIMTPGERCQYNETEHGLRGGG